jgi:hypothetical protein
MLMGNRRSLMVDDRFRQKNNDMVISFRILVQGQFAWSSGISAPFAPEVRHGFVVFEGLMWVLVERAAGCMPAEQPAGLGPAARRLVLPFLSRLVRRLANGRHRCRPAVTVSGL